MARPVKYPNGSWPLEMRAETAAAYCDEPSVEAFLAKVRRGIFPPPCQQQGMLPKWHRTKLDQSIALRHGLATEHDFVTEDISRLL
ncbi:MAG: hypothetical protein AB7G34_07090 [Hyphomicrobiales bacterium]